MKRVSVVAMVVAVCFFFRTVAYSALQGYGPGSGQVDVNALKQFHKETLPLRVELVAKNLELQNEYASQNPDQGKIAALQKEIIDLRTKIQGEAEKQGLPAWGPGWMMGGPGWGPGAGRGHGPWMMGRGGYGGEPGNGGGYGGYCPMW
jgi:hypothetical protein